MRKMICSHNQIDKRLVQVYKLQKRDEAAQVGVEIPKNFLDDDDALKHSRTTEMTPIARGRQHLNRTATKENLVKSPGFSKFDLETKNERDFALTTGNHMATHTN